MTHTLLLSLHLLAATIWVGGMACMHFAVRPAAVSVLTPPQRLPFMAQALDRFFAWVAVSIAVLVATGLAMIARAGGFAALPWSVHTMVVIGLAMAAVFGHIRFALHPRLLRAVAAGDWMVAGAHLSAIRLLVAINLALGALTFVVAVAGRAT